MTIWDKIKIAAGVLGLLLVAGLWVYSAGLRNDLVRTTEQLEDSRRESAGKSLELAAQHQALMDRETVVEQLRNENKALLEEVYQNDPEARTWGDNDCPDGVIACLRK